MIILEEIILNAFERTTGTKRFRENGFIPGVIYGDTVKNSEPVKFEEVPLKRVLERHGSNAKMWIQYGKDKKYGFIKEIQRHPVSDKIIHVDVQLVSKKHEIKLQLPIIFKGEDKLTSKVLQLQIHKPEIGVSGRMDLMPDAVTVDVSEKELGDTVTVKDFNLDKQIKVNDIEGVIYATVAKLKENAEQEDTSEEITE